MRVDDKPHRLVGDFQVFERPLNLLGQWGKLVVDDHDPVFSDRSGNISALAFKHVDVAGNLGHLDLDFRKILVLSFDGRSERQQHTQHQSHFRGPQRILIHCSSSSRRIVPPRLSNSSGTGSVFWLGAARLFRYLQVTDRLIPRNSQTAFGTVLVELLFE